MENDIIQQAMEKIAKNPPKKTKLVYDRARRTIIEVPVDPRDIPPLLIYDEDADFHCGGA